MDLDQMLEGFLQHHGQPGQIRILNHLKSEKGKAMNGLRVMVIGLDPPSVPRSNRRIHVRMLDPNTSQPVGKVLQIKTWNLVDPRNYCSAIPEPTLSGETTNKFLKQAYENGLAQGHDQLEGVEGETRDRFMRMNLIQLHLSNKKDEQETPPKIECMDPLIPPDELNDFESLKSAIRHACVGDGYVDFRRFGEGIIPKGQEMECAICHEKIQDDLIRLPCNHRFHLHCIQPWVEKESSCPTCRQVLTHSLDTYVFRDVQRQIQNRFDEWFISGMCERCQVVCMENDPVVSVIREDGKEATMPLSAAKLYGYTNYRSLQGQSMEKINIVSGFY